jgi:hypothetical protein
MSNDNKILRLILIGLIIPILFGCTKSTSRRTEVNFTQSATTISITSSPSRTRTLTPLPTKTISPTANFFRIFPTILPTFEPGIKKALVDPECVLPCYLGIMPGRTSSEEAIRIIEGFGGVLAGKKDLETGDSSRRYTLNISVSPTDEDPKYAEDPLRYEMFLIDHSVELVTKDGKLSEYIIWMSSTMPVDEYEKARIYWGRYTVAGVMQQLGMPDNIFLIDTGYSLDMLPAHEVILDYRSKGIMIKITGDGEINNVCLDLTAGWYSIGILEYGDKKPQNIDENSIFRTSLPSGKSNWIPIEKGLGVSTEEFYSKIMKNPSMCFKRKQ